MNFKPGILSLGILSLSQAVFAIPADNTIHVIIKYKEKNAITSLKSQITKATQLPVKAMSPMANGAYALVLDSSHSGLAKDTLETTYHILNRLRQNPNVLYAVKDRVGYFKPVPNPAIDDSLSTILSHDSQWDEFSRPAGIMLESKPGARDGAWSITTGKADNPVVVAVLDTGVALNDSLVNSLLKDKNGKVWGWNFAGNNNNLTDETRSYHGTHVAGTIAGYGDVMNGVGEDLKILTVKIPASDGMFYESAVINGIYWSVGADVPGVPTNHYPAKVLNMSFGVDLEGVKEADYCDAALQEAVFYARERGAVIAAAAGNDNVWEHFNAPAVCNGTIKIASTGPEGLRSYFSNYGPSVTLAAPGGDKRYGTIGAILSTVNPGGGYNGSGFDFYQGTSMASPHVAGVAGLVYAINNSLSAEQVEQLLYVTTHDFGKSKDTNKSCVGKKPCGHGILDAENAVKAALANYDVLFSAPTSAAIESQACGLDKVRPGIIKVSDGTATWVQKESACDTADSYTRPHVLQDKNGVIAAFYGATRYELDQRGFKGCKVIGNNGIGCYR